MKLNDKGFSLVQVLISSGLLGAAAVVGIKMMNNQQKVAESTNQKYEMAYIHEEIWRSLQNPITCERTLKGKSIASWNNGELKSINIPFKDGKFDNYIKIYKTYDSGFEFYGIRNLKIDNYYLSESDIDSTVNLQIEFNRGKNIVGSQKIKKSIPISYTLVGNIIDTCNSLALTDDKRDEDELEDKEIKGALSNKGNVTISLDSSIGTNKEPESTLDVFGNLSITTKEQLPCKKDLEGSIRFNKTSNAYEFCTGSGDWKIWGKNRIDWQRSTNRVVLAGNKNFIGRFRYCSLSAISNAEIDHCKLDKESFDLKTKIDWFVSKSNNKSNGSCTFTCFD